MTLFFGRANYPLGIDDPDKWDEHGDVVTCGGELYVASPANALALRQQMTGYMNNRDEPFVHLASDQDPTINGFYTVDDMQVTSATHSLTTGWFQWAASLRRVSTYATSQLEQISVGSLRTNSASVAAGTCLDPFWVGNIVLPDITSILNTGGRTTYSKLTADPQILAPASQATTYAAVATGPGTNNAFAYQNDSSAYGVDPYVGHARLELSYDAGATWQIAVGTKIPDVGNAMWRLSNGLIRFYADTTGKLFISTATGVGAFSTPKGIGLIDPAANWTDVAAVAFAGMSALRVGPLETVIRVHYPVSVTVTMTVDISLKAFQPFVTAIVYGSAAANLAVRTTAVTASTAITAGIRATSNDASGNRHVFAAPVAVTNDLVNGSITTTATTKQVAFLIGLEIAGTGSATPFTAADMVNQYMWAASHTLRVVGR